MKKYLLAGTMMMFVLICCSAEATAQKFSKVVTDADRWDPIAVDEPVECSGDPQECALKALGAMKINVGDEPDFSVYRLGKTDGREATVVFVSHLPEGDDSVLGILYRVKLSADSGEPGKYRLDELGRMFQCMRGPEGWRKTLCP